MSDIIFNLGNNIPTTGTYINNVPAFAGPGNRFALLQSYSLANQRDSWVCLGSMVMTNTSAVYTQGMLFQVNVIGSPLNGALVYVNTSYTAPTGFTWSTLSAVGDTNGSIIDSGTNIVNANFNLLMTLAQFTSIVPAYDPTFRPFQEVGSGALMSVSDQELEIILTAVGVPFINLNELEFTRNQIINDFIWPAVLEYYKYFPITSLGKYPLADTNFVIPMPAYPVFSVLHAQVVPGYPIQNTSGNPVLRYFDETLMSISPRGAFSTPNLNSSRRQGYVDTQSYSTFILEKAARQGIINYSTRRRVNVQVQAGYIKGYTTQRGVLEITFGAYSQNWNDILLNRIAEVRDLARANILRGLGTLRSLVPTGQPGSLDYQIFLARADRLEDRVKEIWSNSVVAPLIRIS